MSTMSTRILRVWIVTCCLWFWSGSLTAGQTAWAQARSGVQRPQTWKTVSELSDEEKALVDFRTDTPRDATIPYLPAEKFPFQPPYTAEEMGLRAMEFPHSPFWDCTLVDLAFTVTNSGFMSQRVTIIPILYLLQGGFAEQLYGAKSGQEVYRWLTQ